MMAHGLPYSQLLVTSLPAKFDLGVDTGEASNGMLHYVESGSCVLTLCSGNLTRQGRTHLSERQFKAIT